MDRRDRFAANMKRARAKLDISQEELSFRCKLHLTTISLYERGERKPGMDAILKLAVSLETTPADLYAGIEWLPEEQRFAVERPVGAAA
jgi:transcriptional regulator with XRE-family HTH domain